MTPTQDLTLAGLVHDLRNVFETLGDAAEALSGDPKWARTAAAISRAVERGQRIAASFEESAQTFDLDGIVRNATQATLDFRAASHLPELRFETGIEPGIRLAGQPGAWERVLVNLFVNAAHAMPEGGDIAIRARRTGGFVELAVSDTGPGIAPSILPELFKPGFSTRRAHSGLGLSIVDSIVRAHGGTVEAGNREDRRGARFTIRIPDSQAAIPLEPHPVAVEGLPDSRVDECA